MDGAKLLDKRLSESTKLSEWCPTMDLIALVNVKDVITIQRLETKQCSWQKLCGIEPESEVTSLCWKPDGCHTPNLYSSNTGKVIATGHADGKLRLWEVETGKPIEGQTHLHSAAISHLSWVQESVSKPTSVRFSHP